MNDLATWIKTSTNGASLRAVAERMGRSPDSLYRWVRQGKMPAEAIVEFARIYHADLLTGALVGGVIDVPDVQRAMPQLLRYATPEQLVSELHRKMAERTFRTAAS